MKSSPTTGKGTSMKPSPLVGEGRGGGGGIVEGPRPCAEGEGLRLLKEGKYVQQCLTTYTVRHASAGVPALPAAPVRGARAEGERPARGGDEDRRPVCQGERDGAQARHGPAEGEGAASGRDGDPWRGLASGE